MAFSDFWGAKLKDSLVFRLWIIKIHLLMHQFLCALITKMILRAMYMARRGALSIWPVFALLWLDALMDVAITLLLVVCPDVSVAISSLMLAVLFRNIFCLQLRSSSKSIGTSVLLAQRRYIL
jgi:hypothetical protein